MDLFFHLPVYSLVDSYMCPDRELNLPPGLSGCPSNHLSYPARPRYKFYILRDFSVSSQHFTSTSHSYHVEVIPVTNQMAEISYILNILYLGITYILLDLAQLSYFYFTGDVLGRIFFSALNMLLEMTNYQLYNLSIFFRYSNHRLHMLSI